MAEKYCYTVGEKGQEGLNILEKSFNAQTLYFLLKHGLQAGMSVLDIGCGLGLMTQEIAKVVGPQGQVVAIDNNANQMHAAKIGLYYII